MKTNTRRPTAADKKQTISLKRALKAADKHTVNSQKNRFKQSASMRERGMANLKKHGMTIADFIRRHPQLKAQVIVELGKAKGMKFTPQHVYTVRATDKKRADKANGGGLLHVNKALMKSAVASANSDRIVQRFASEMCDRLRDTDVTKILVNIRTREIEQYTEHADRLRI